MNPNRSATTAGDAVVISRQEVHSNLTMAFGGVKAASSTFDSYNQITATVRRGAKTGKIGVSTPGGTATSAETFTVTI